MNVTATQGWEMRPMRWRERCSAGGDGGCSPHWSGDVWRIVHGLHWCDEGEATPDSARHVWLGFDLLRSNVRRVLLTRKLGEVAVVVQSEHARFGVIIRHNILPLPCRAGACLRGNLLLNPIVAVGQTAPALALPRSCLWPARCSDGGPRSCREFSSIVARRSAGLARRARGNAMGLRQHSAAVCCYVTVCEKVPLAVLRCLMTKCAKRADIATGRTFLGLYALTYNVILNTAFGAKAVCPHFTNVPEFLDCVQVSNYLVIRAYPAVDCHSDSYRRQLWALICV